MSSVGFVVVETTAMADQRNTSLNDKFFEHREEVADFLAAEGVVGRVHNNTLVPLFFLCLEYVSNPSWTDNNLPSEFRDLIPFRDMLREYRSTVTNGTDYTPEFIKSFHTVLIVMRAAVAAADALAGAAQIVFDSRDTAIKLSVAASISFNDRTHWGIILNDLMPMFGAFILARTFAHVSLHPYIDHDTFFQLVDTWKHLKRQLPAVNPVASIQTAGFFVSKSTHEQRLLIHKSLMQAQEATVASATISPSCFMIGVRRATSFISDHRKKQQDKARLDKDRGAGKPSSGQFTPQPKPSSHNPLTQRATAVHTPQPAKPSCDRCKGFLASDSEAALIERCKKVHGVRNATGFFFTIKNGANQHDTSACGRFASLGAEPTAPK